MAGSVTSVSGASFTLTAANYVAISTSTLNATWTLPDPTTCTGRIYMLINIGTIDIFVSPVVTTANNITTHKHKKAAGSNHSVIISDGLNRIEIR